MTSLKMLIVLFGCMVLPPSAAHGEKYESRIPVQVVVAGQSDIKAELMSYLTREFRALTDVVVQKMTLSSRSALWP